MLWSPTLGLMYFEMWRAFDMTPEEGGGEKS